MKFEFNLGGAHLNSSEQVWNKSGKNKPLPIGPSHKRNTMILVNFLNKKTVTKFQSGILVDVLCLYVEITEGHK